ncbi:flagellar assembly protein FliH [Bacillus pakistanensis]|uniref:Flagellar assembly protein FliH n=1 Tax=Rossellomorea pakistanensis TaxID=992288 RepID=A0ABS2NG38_9BACI|nr:flagellar assembly protein FliH [Bacillus pakistanensis]MBM7586831.1 flagellar assembly protein FliH [Bacillus pakistanensis]
MSRIIKADSEAYPTKGTRRISLRSIALNDNEFCEDSSSAMENIEQLKSELILQARKEADMLIKEATALKESMMNEIVCERQQMEKENERLAHLAKEDGYFQGFREGQQKGYQEMKEMLSQAKEIVDSTQTEFHQHLEKSEKTIVEIGIKVAEKIIGGILDEQPEVFLNIVKRGLKEVRELPHVQIHIHPTKYSLLDSHREELEAVFPSTIQMYLYPNEELQEMDCFIESNNGRVMVSINDQLTEIKNKLIELLEGEDS